MVIDKTITQCATGLSANILGLKCSLRIVCIEKCEKSNYRLPSSILWWNQPYLIPFVTLFVFIMAVIEYVTSLMLGKDCHLIFECCVQWCCLNQDNFVKFFVETKNAEPVFLWCLVESFESLDAFVGDFDSWINHNWRL